MNPAIWALAPLAVVQMVLPAPTQAAFVLVPICGEGGHARPIRIPGKNDGSGPGGAPCCKICHIAMRKRSGGDSGCCGDGEDDLDAA
ncbi:hypothetical protein [Novosphingobium sp.]|uniref:hypothetical protein n=1 Tax=Novosphingobium sp. TaxID=1874826 RepID=UPI0038B818CD